VCSTVDEFNTIFEPKIQYIHTYMVYMVVYEYVMMMIVFITIKSGLVPLIKGLCAQISYFRFEIKSKIISGLRSHLLLFFVGRKKYVQGKSSHDSFHLKPHGSKILISFFSSLKSSKSHFQRISKNLQKRSVSCLDPNLSQAGNADRTFIQTTRRQRLVVSITPLQNKSTETATLHFARFYEIR